MSRLVIRLLLIATLFLNFSNLLLSQSNRANISFTKTEYDFGKIKEEHGSCETSFEFINTGGQPLIIGNVEASCGCTTPSWTKTPIPPGGKGHIKASYNPQGRPGKFSKLITVTSNAENSPNRLTITGIVVPKEKSIEDNYPVKIETLRLTSDRVGFTPILNTETKSEKIEIINAGSEPVSISFDKVPKHLKVKSEPSKLNPQEKGIILITYDATIVKEWEYVTDNFFIKINDKNLSNNRINVTAMIKEDFSKLSAKELINSPIAVIDKKIFEFGTIKQGDKVENSFILKNEGKSNLIIRTTKSSCGCTAINPADKLIAPGKSTTIKVIFDSKDKIGIQDKTVTIITNDHKNSVIVLWLKGNVEQKI